MERVEGAGRPCWRAAAPHLRRAVLAVIPFYDEPDASVDEDAWRTRAAAVRALAENHALDLNLAS